MANPRQEQLLKLVIDKGYYTVEDLAEALAVSTQTIRRDIKKLSDERLLGPATMVALVLLLVR